MNSAMLTGIGMTSARTRARMIEHLREQEARKQRLIGLLGPQLTAKIKAAAMARLRPALGQPATRHRDLPGPLRTDPRACIAPTRWRSAVRVFAASSAPTWQGRETTTLVMGSAFT